MGTTIHNVLFAAVAAALLVTTGCKSDGSYREEQKTQGEEVEEMGEHGDTAIDAADETEE